MLKKEELEYLYTLPLFKGMSKKDVELALKCIGAFQKEYEKDEFVILEEDKVQCVGCVLSGKIHMIREDFWGNQAVLLTIGEKELFGESFACGAQLIASASFVTKEKTKVLFLPFHRVMHTCPHACSYHHKLIVNMVALIAEKNIAFISKIDIMSKKTLKEKIVAYLLMQSSYYHSKYFTIPLGRVQLADYLGVDRSALTRELTRMKEEGFIDFEKNTFRLLKNLE